MLITLCRNCSSNVQFREDAGGGELRCPNCDSRIPNPARRDDRDSNVPKSVLDMYKYRSDVNSSEQQPNRWDAGGSRQSNRAAWVAPLVGTIVAGVVG